MQICTMLVGLTAEYEHIVAVITSSRQLYDLFGVTTGLLDTEVHQQDNIIQISPNLGAFNVQT